MLHGKSISGVLNRIFVDTVRKRVVCVQKVDILNFVTKAFEYSAKSITLCMQLFGFLCMCIYLPNLNQNCVFPILNFHKNKANKTG